MRYLIPLIFLCSAVCTHAQPDSKQKHLLQRVLEFFSSLEAQDSTAFRSMFVDPAYLYAVREVSRDSAVVRARPFKGYPFRAGHIVRERMRESSTSVRIDGPIAMVWAPYDLWVNDTFSHCGVDVFTFVRIGGEWKIASLAYTIDTGKCR